MDSDSDAYLDNAMTDSEDDFMASEDDEPVKSAARKKVAVLASKDNEMNLSAPSKASVNKAKSKKTVEEIYQKKTQLEHILLRPDTYSELTRCCS